MKTIHLLAPFHTAPSPRFSMCAFTAKALNFAKMIRPFGYHVIEYANEGSESEADAHVVMLSERERIEAFPGGQPFALSPGADRFRRRSLAALDDRVSAGDIIVHLFGFVHSDLFKALPDAIHVETGVGYLDRPFGAHRVYESDQWRHYHWGLADALGLTYPDKADRSKSWVIPMGFDPDDWPIGDGLGDERGPYALFMGRPIGPKGVNVVRELGTRGVRVKVAGCADPGGWPKSIEFLGPVLGRERAPLVGSATCVLMPTTDIEPFGAAGVEGMMAGTPLVASDWGGFRDTVEPGVTGLRCRSVDDFAVAIEKSETLDRAVVAARARERFSLAAVGAQLDAVFRELSAAADHEAGIVEAPLEQSHDLDHGTHAEV